MPRGQKRVLQELHSTHPGMNKMKSLARSYVWWPQLDEDIDSVVRECSICRELQTPERERTTVYIYGVSSVSPSQFSSTYMLQSLSSI